MIDNKKLYELRLDGNTFYVLWYLSYGYDWALSIGKEYYEASYKQIREHTGIKKDDTIIKCIRILIEKGLITQQTEFIGGNKKSKSKFTSNIVQKIDHSTPKNGVMKSKKWSNNTPKNGVMNTPKNGELSKEKESKEISKESNGDFSYGDCFILEEVN